MSTIDHLKLQSRINLDNWRATHNWTYLARAINQTRLALYIHRNGD